MPEGPSIIILKEQLLPFRGKKVLEVSSNSKQDIQRMSGKKILDFQSWGKHTLIQFPGFFVKIHLLMFGSYRINEEKEGKSPRLSLKFTKGEINFYNCGLQIFEGTTADMYEWSSDIMSDEWNPKKAEERLKGHPDMLVCDALLDQNIFSGVGNIIKNEVLFRIKVHPSSTIGALPRKKLLEMIKEARIYSFQFLEWKKDFTLKKHWLAHTKKECPRDHIPLKKTHLGKTRRRTFYCEKCQMLYV